MKYFSCPPQGLFCIYQIPRSFFILKLESSTLPTSHKEMTLPIKTFMIHCFSPSPRRCSFSNVSENLNHSILMAGAVFSCILSISIRFFSNYSAGSPLQQVKCSHICEIFSASSVPCHWSMYLSFLMQLP